MVRIKLTRLYIFLIFLTGILITGCQKDDILNPDPISSASELSSDVAVKWFDLELQLIKKTSGFTPPVTARALGYSGITLYESVVQGSSQYKSLSSLLNQMPQLTKADANDEYHWGASANSALAEIIRNLFAKTSAENLQTINALEEEFKSKFKNETSEEVVNRSAEFGKKIALEIFEWSKIDGGHECYSKNFPAEYVPPVGPGMWVPTGSTGAMQPYWGNNRPFVSMNTTVDIVVHPPYSTDKNSLFYAQALEVYSTSKNLTAAQEEIAKFWSDDPVTTYTPPGHSISIATQVIKKEKAKLDKAAEVYAKIGIAVNDAFICCWKTKFQYNLLRPITYINNEIDPAWKPMLNTPPFPEYSSGHSVQSAATAQILSDVFGYHYEFTDDTHADRGLASRHFNSFYEYADEAAVSRLYGGIHYRAAIENGIAQGFDVGNNISSLQFFK